MNESNLDIRKVLEKIKADVIREKNLKMINDWCKEFCIKNKFSCLLFDVSTNYIRSVTTEGMKLSLNGESWININDFDILDSRWIGNIIITQWQDIKSNIMRKHAKQMEQIENEKNFTV